MIGIFEVEAQRLVDEHMKTVQTIRQKYDSMPASLDSPADKEIRLAERELKKRAAELRNKYGINE